MLAQGEMIRLISGMSKMSESTPSLAEVYRSVRVPAAGAPWFRKLFAFFGPGMLVAVGYMDPGNWATDLAGGSRYGYTLLFVILLSNLMAILLQHLCVKLGVVTGRDLAQACRDHYSDRMRWVLWGLCELAIAACDLAEVIGAAIALQLLFGIPLVWGCVITVVDVFVVMLLQNKGMRYLEALIVTLILTIGVCFAIQIFYAQPEWAAVGRGFLPSAGIFRDSQMLLVAVGILGATVMPHNLYLHSSIVQTRDFSRDEAGKKEAIRYASWDSSLSLMFALFINAGILILAAAVFHKNSREVGEIQDAYELLSPMLGVSVASTLFAVALLASGQSSTLTGTLAGQIVMEGFLNFRMAPWLRRMVTRLIAVVPAVVIIAMFGEKETTNLLLWSQVILSLQLSFAVVPLLQFTGSKKLMGKFANPWWLQILGWTIASVIIVLNVKFLWDTIAGFFA